MSDDRRDQKTPRASQFGAAPHPPGAARLYALVAGGFLSLLGVLGWFYDAGFGTGLSLADDDLAGILVVNGWRNVVYLATGLIALALSTRRSREVAWGLGAFYLVFAIWGFDVTDRGIGSILDTLPLGDNDNVLHLMLGVFGLSAAIADGPLPKAILPKRLRPGSRSGSGARRRVRAGPRRGDAAEPR